MIKRVLNDLGTHLSATRAMCAVGCIFELHLLVNHPSEYITQGPNYLGGVVVHGKPKICGKVFLCLKGSAHKTLASNFCYDISNDFLVATGKIRYV